MANGNVPFYDIVGLSRGLQPGYAQGVLGGTLGEFWRPKIFESPRWEGGGLYIDSCITVTATLMPLLLLCH